MSVTLLPMLEDLLEKRGIAPKDWEAFLKPDFVRDLHDPSSMKGMSEAVALLGQALTEKQLVVVFGDYDADGVPGTALLTQAMRDLGMIITPVIPLRSEGYGLTVSAVERLVAMQPAIVLTIDNGTVAAECVAQLQNHGIKVIVIDHHQPHGTVATPEALVNPKQSDCPYPEKELCGCALAWKVCWAVYQDQGADTQRLKLFLDLVAIATVADMMPLIGENRTLVQFGLQILRRSANKGLRALTQVSGSTLEKHGVGSIGFGIAPRLNAPSRMHAESFTAASGMVHPHAALALLLSETTEEAAELAAYCHQCNTDRQELVRIACDEAITQVEQHYADDPVLVVYGAHWSTGVIGLIAGKLMERFSRPVIACAPEHGVIKGSVRTVSGASALDLLDAGSAYLAQYGGHEKAAGCTLLPELTEVDQLRSALVSYAKQQGWTCAAFAKGQHREADLNLEIDAITAELAEQLELLAPYGYGFATPQIRCIGSAQAVRPMGSSGQHLSIEIAALHGGSRIQAVAFSPKHTPPSPGELYQWQGTVEQSTWNGRVRTQLMLNHWSSVVVA
jgi:single-stranded-DNA-specific exonuclease